MNAEHKDFKTLFRKMVYKKVLQDKRTYQAIADLADVKLTIIHQLIYNKGIGIESLEKIGRVYGYRLSVVVGEPIIEDYEPEQETIKTGVVNGF